MFTYILTVYTLALLVLSPVSALPVPRREAIAKRDVPAGSSDFDVLVQGNQQFRKNVDKGLMDELKAGQHPPFMMISCSDSRVGEGTIFNAKPGVFFTERNIANQVLPDDGNAQSALAYGVTELRVKHVIVMGHYGCGGVAAATLPAPRRPQQPAATAIQKWLTPIRELYSTSTRPEVAAMREANKDVSPGLNDPGFRALIEENVKANVQRIAEGPIIRNWFQLLSENPDKPATNGTVIERAADPSKPPAPVFIHGWIYDIADGKITDLKASVGPPGMKIPQVPFSDVATVAKRLVSGGHHNH
ncbi:Carbonic anhydrase 2 [Hypsizygus marmoreus]|uniref:Carbonic anhydrase n=1 Tax=Hypsizygus marmoreus TaxID=39966 RepID=A0A369K8S5_HYPMA|nr:Carbonic anhydrase 2 [Hypsizygus marmoreus]